MEPTSHSCTSIVQSVGSVVSVYNIIYNRFSSLCTSAMSHPLSLVCAIFTGRSCACNSSVTTVCMALVIVSLTPVITLPLVT